MFFILGFYPHFIHLTVLHITLEFWPNLTITWHVWPRSIYGKIYFSFLGVYLNAKKENDKLTPSNDILIKESDYCNRQRRRKQWRKQFKSLFLLWNVLEFYAIFNILRSIRHSRVPSVDWQKFGRKGQAWSNLIKIRWSVSRDIVNNLNNPIIWVPQHYTTTDKPLLLV